jgi:sulfatase modifying factor 1
MARVRVFVWVSFSGMLAVACYSGTSSDGHARGDAAGEAGVAGSAGTSDGAGREGRGGSTSGSRGGAAGNGSGGRGGAGAMGGAASGQAGGEDGESSGGASGRAGSAAEEAGAPESGGGAGDLGGAPDAGRSGHTGGGGTSGSGSGGTDSGGNGGNGCTGGLEEVVDELCVAKMGTVPSEAGEFRIDRTEVTRGQYEAWLATKPSPVPVVITACSLNSTYEPRADCVLADGPDASHHPMACIDWCDARFYCAAVGKRLCGSTTGGGFPYEPSSSDWRKDQWELACNGGGDQIFTYGEPYSAAACNTEGSGTQAVASLSSCQSTDADYAGIYDLNGNVREWIDQCDPDLSSSECYTRGGGFDDGSVACATLRYGTYRLTSREDLGFRCCSK